MFFPLHISAYSLPKPGLEGLGLKLDLLFPRATTSATASFFSSADKPLFTVAAGPFLTISTGNMGLFAELGSALRGDGTGKVVTVESLDGLGARLLIPARLGARAGIPIDSGT